MVADARTLDESLVSEDFIRDPYPTLDLLRATDPIHWSESIGGWVLTRYDDALVSFMEVASYSNEGRLGRASAYLPPETRAKLRPFEDHYRTKSLIHSDPPDHTRLRKLVQTSFSSRAIEALRPHIQEIVDDLLDRVAPAGHMEVIADLAFPLPVTVLAGLLGVPASDSAIFKSWTDRILAFQGVNKPGADILLTAQAALLEARAYLSDLVARRHQRSWRRPDQSDGDQRRGGRHAVRRGDHQLEHHAADRWSRDHHLVDRQWTPDPAPAS